MNVLTVVEKVCAAVKYSFLHFARYVLHKQTKDIRIQMSFAEDVNIFITCWLVQALLNSTNAYSCEAKHEINASCLPLQLFNQVLDIQAKRGTTNFKGYNPKVGYIISNNILPDTLNDLICEYRRHVNFQSTNFTVVKRRWLELCTIVIRLLIYVSYISATVHLSYLLLKRTFDTLKF